MPMQSITPGNRRRVKVSVWDGMSAEELFIKVRNTTEYGSKHQQLSRD